MEMVLFDMITKLYLKHRFKTGKKPTGEDFAALIDGVTRHRETFISTENQTVFNLANQYRQHNNQIEVYIGGVPQFSPDNFTETSTTSFTLAGKLQEGIEVVVNYYE